MSNTDFYFLHRLINFLDIIKDAKKVGNAPDATNTDIFKKLLNNMFKELFNKYQNNYRNVQQIFEKDVYDEINKISKLFKGITYKYKYLSHITKYHEDKKKETLFNLKIENDDTLLQKDNKNYNDRKMIPKSYTNIFVDASIKPQDYTKAKNITIYTNAGNYLDPGSTKKTNVLHPFNNELILDYYNYGFDINYKIGIDFIDEKKDFIQINLFIPENTNKFIKSTYKMNYKKEKTNINDNHDESGLFKGNASKNNYLVKNNKIIDKNKELIGLKYLFSKEIGDTSQVIIVKNIIEKTSEFTNENTCILTSDKVLFIRCILLNVPCFFKYGAFNELYFYIPQTDKYIQKLLTIQYELIEIDNRYNILIDTYNSNLLNLFKKENKKIKLYNNSNIQIDKNKNELIIFIYIFLFKNIKNLSKENSEYIDIDLNLLKLLNILNDFNKKNIADEIKIKNIKTDGPEANLFIEKPIDFNKPYEYFNMIYSRKDQFDFTNFEKNKEQNNYNLLIYIFNNHKKIINSIIEIITQLSKKTENELPNYLKLNDIFNNIIINLKLEKIFKLSKPFNETNIILSNFYFTQLNNYDNIINHINSLEPNIKNILPDLVFLLENTNEAIKLYNNNINTFIHFLNFNNFNLSYFKYDYEMKGGKFKTTFTKPKSIIYKTKKTVLNPKKTILNSKKTFKTNTNINTNIDTNIDTNTEKNIFINNEIQEIIYNLMKNYINEVFDSKTIENLFYPNKISSLKKYKSAPTNLINISKKTKKTKKLKSAPSKFNYKSKINDITIHDYTSSKKTKKRKRT